MQFSHLLKRYQKIHTYLDATFPQVTGEYRTLARLGKITEELGELCSAVHGELHLHRQDKQAQHQSSHVASEWADLFNTVILMGLVLDLDLEAVIEQRLNEIDDRYHLND